MRLLDTEVKYFDRDTYKIPEYGNTWGCIVDYLDTCLVNGTEGQEVLSITTTDDPEYPGIYWLSRIMLNPGHGFKENLSVIEISECSEPIYNGVHRVQEAGESYIKIALETSKVPDQPKDVTFTTGMSISQPPLGFEKPYSAPQKAVYKVTTKEGKYCYLRVDNSCPEGHDPSHAKFARVSMFEEMSHVDDYKYKSGIKKCPMYENDPDRVEESIYNVWFSTRYSYDDYYHFRTTPYNHQNPFECLVGTSTMFYLHIYELRHSGYSGDGNRDETYFFGTYLKNSYKEDPLPFILRCSTRETTTSDYFLRYSDQSSLLKGGSGENYTFSTSNNSFIYPNTHEKFYISNNGLISGMSTGVSFTPYKNELTINIIKNSLVFSRTDGNILEGDLPGLYLIKNNLQDYKEESPRMYEVYKTRESSYYLHLPDDYHYSSTNSREKVPSYMLALEGWYG